jgi:hypothetical protein
MVSSTPRLKVVPGRTERTSAIRLTRVCAATGPALAGAFGVKIASAKKRNGPARGAVFFRISRIVMKEIPPPPFSDEENKIHESRKAEDADRQNVPAQKIENIRCGHRSLTSLAGVL